MIDHSLIVSEPGNTSGAAMVRGTNISVGFVLQELAAGWTIEQFLQTYPQVTREGVLAALAFAADLANAYHVPVPDESAATPPPASEVVPPTVKPFTPPQPSPWPKFPETEEEWAQQRERNQAAIRLLQEWRQGDPREQREAFEALQKVLDEDPIRFREFDFEDDE